MQSVALIGKMRSGKDCAADYLRTFHPGPIVKFADPLYEMQSAIYEIADLTMNSEGKDRRLLQYNFCETD